jgi:hypothetical protein
MDVSLYNHQRKDAASGSAPEYAEEQMYREIRSVGYGEERHTSISPF